MTTASVTPGGQRTAVVPQPCSNRVVPLGEHTSEPFRDLPAPNGKATSHLNGNSSPVRQHVTTWQLLGAVYMWSTWLFIFMMTLTQFLGIVWDSMSTEMVINYSPNRGLGPYQMLGTNDMPYSDRLLACFPRGQGYIPVQLNDALASDYMSTVDTDSPEYVGYRTLQRDSGLVLDSAMFRHYSRTCSLLSETLDAVLENCGALGYNVTRDSLRIVNGVDSSTTHLLLKSLPVLIMPVYDNSPTAKYMIPGWDGSACSFSLRGKYVDSSQTQMLLAGVDREIREEKTEEWLLRPGGTWRNGWYEDLRGGKWFSDCVGSTTHEVEDYGVTTRQFDTLNRLEVDCAQTPSVCPKLGLVSTWGKKFRTEDESTSAFTVSVGNATHFGFMWFHTTMVRRIRCVYDWETLLSNVTVLLQLGRWMVSMIALHRGYLYQGSRWFNGGIGCLANSTSFTLYPLTMLPRLRMTLAAFWTVGCRFEGIQGALSEAWFAIYPAIVELMLVYYSLLNVAAKVLRRRMSDALFAPTIVFFCLLHKFRGEAAIQRWFGVKAQVTTVVFSDEVDQLTLYNFFSSDIALRMNGNVAPMFRLKLAVLALNLLPLLLAKSFPVTKKNSLDRDHLHGVERSLAVNPAQMGGLGRSTVYMYEPSRGFSNGQTIKTALNGYELLRMGYLVFGDAFLVGFEDWEVIAMLMPLRRIHHLWNHRVVVFSLSPCKRRLGVAAVSGRAKLVRLDDPQLLQLPFWQISVCAFDCSHVPALQHGSSDGGIRRGSQDRKGPRAQINS